MNYVGVRGSAAKTAVLRSRPADSVRVRPDELAFDCIRHLDLLARYRESGPETDLASSLYCRYLVSTGRGREAAVERAQGFLALFERIRADGLGAGAERIAVTREGVRLNGSHRAAIAQTLALDEVEVDVHEWRGPFARRRARHVLLEADVKRAGQTAFVGKRARAPHSGVVAFVDASLRTPRWWFAGAAPAAELLLVVDDGEHLHTVPAVEVTLE